MPLQMSLALTTNSFDLWLGHSKTLTLLSRNYFLVNFEMCFWLSSCWKLHWYSNPSFFLFFFFFLVDWYFGSKSKYTVVHDPLIFNQATNHTGWKSLYSIMLQPPCLTWCENVLLDLKHYLPFCKINATSCTQKVQNDNRINNFSSGSIPNPLIFYSVAFLDSALNCLNWHLKSIGYGFVAFPYIVESENV